MLRQRHVSGLDGIADVQCSDSHDDRLRDAKVRTCDCQCFGKMPNGTAVLQPYRLAAEFNRNLDCGPAVRIDAQQIKMANRSAERIPLNFLNDGLVDLAVQFNVDD